MSPILWLEYLLATAAGGLFIGGTLIALRVLWLYVLGLVSADRS